MNVHAADPASFIVPRRGAAATESSLCTSDRRVMLILRDTVVVLQLTDRGMDELMKYDDSTGTRGLSGLVQRSPANGEVREG